MVNPTRITIQDIAQSVDVPVDQVTKVILGQPGVSDDLRRRILTTMEQAGLVRMSHETAKGTIGVAISGAVIDDYVGSVVRGVSEVVKNQEYSPVLSIQGLSQTDDLDQPLRPADCAGIIAIVPNNYHLLLDRCRQYQRPYVLIDYQRDDDLDDALTIEVKNRQSILNVMDHLFSFGHQRIAFITGSLIHASAQQRLQGYKDALAEAGIPYDSALVGEGNWMHASGYEAAQHFLKLDNPPTAIVASNDLEAFGAMQAARAAGREIGVDLSITGFDDISMASTVTPALTTVRQPMRRLGEAAEMLIKVNTGQRLTERHVQLDTELIIRQSTGAARR